MEESLPATLQKWLTPGGPLNKSRMHRQKEQKREGFKGVLSQFP